MDEGGNHRQSLPSPPMDFYKIIALNTDLEQVISDHQHVGPAGINGDAPKLRGLPQVRTTMNAFFQAAQEN